MERIPNPAIEVNIYNDKGIIEIKDNGIGIDEKMMGKIFEPYLLLKQKVQV